MPSTSTHQVRRNHVVVIGGGMGGLVLLAEPASLLRPAIAWRVLARRRPSPPASPPAPLRGPAPAFVA